MKAEKERKDNSSSLNKKDRIQDIRKVKNPQNMAKTNSLMLDFFQQICKLEKRRTDNVCFYLCLSFSDFSYTAIVMYNEYWYNYK